MFEAANVFAEDRISEPELLRIFENGPGLSEPVPRSDGAAAGSAPAGGTGTEAPFHAESFEAFKNESEALFFRRKLEENDGNFKRTAETLGM